MTRSARKYRPSALCGAMALVCLCACSLADTPAGPARAVTAPADGSADRGASAASVPATMPASAPAGAWDLGKSVPDLRNSESTSRLVQWIIPITVLAIAPAVLVMVTSFTRIIVVLGLLRQALAAPQSPPNQVIFGLALFMTVVVMAPVFRAVQADAISPYMDGRISQEQAFRSGETHLRTFMIRQIESGGNTADVYLFLDDNLAAKPQLTWGQVPTISLVPAYVISELKIAFTMGFRIFLPFLVIDMLVSSVLVSMGMLMLPPVLVSLPFKLLLFVLADGWRLVVGTLMSSFG